MSSLAFDTHRAVKALCEACATESLAEAFVKTIDDAISGNVATKADISASEAALRADIHRVEATLRAKIAESEARVQPKIADVWEEVKIDIGLVRAEIGVLEARLYRQLWIMAAGIVGLTVALVKLLG